MKYNLEKFILAHQKDYDKALNEIERGKKESHWMWYIFPQVKDLGRSSPSKYYAISSLDEAEAFLANPYLGVNLHEICSVLLRLDTSNAIEVFGKPDDKKLRSSMTLFAYAAGNESVYIQVLDKFFHGRYDNRTKKILGLE